MLKKIIVLGVLIVMVLSFAGCDSELAEYKTTAKTELETYAEEKGQENYTVENWTTIEGLVADGKAAIDAAKDKAGVVTLISEAKAAIDEVEKDAIDYFILTITVDKSTATHGQKINASAVLKNNSGQPLEIATQRLIGWHISDWYFSDYIQESIPEEPRLIQLEKGDNHIGIYSVQVEPEQNTGIFELQATVSFYLNYGEQNEKQVKLKSNNILITVQ